MKKLDMAVKKSNKVEEMEGVLSIDPTEVKTCEQTTMYFGPVRPYTINTDNINNMNDVRHIVKLLDIRMTEDRARDLPLHLVKHIDDK